MEDELNDKEPSQEHNQLLVETGSDNPNLHSQHFLTQQIPWILKNGMMVLFGITMVLITLTGFINYPEVISIKSKVCAISPPKEIVNKTGGRIIKLFKNEGDYVNYKDIVAYIESTANHGQVIKLSQLLYQLKTMTDENRLEDLSNYWSLHQSDFSELGELQAQHQTFVKSVLNFKNYLSNGFYLKKKSILNQDLHNEERLYTNILEQQTLQQQDLKLQEVNYVIADTLHKNSVYTDFEWREKQSQLLGKKMSLPTTRSSLINNQAHQNSIKKEILDLDNQISQERNLFVEALYSYINAIEDWRKKYLLEAPQTGKLTYSSFVNENQFFKSDKPICYVLKETNIYVVEANIPINLRSKIKIGLDVSVKFPSYPTAEFGVVKGIVLEIKEMPQDSFYLAKIGLPNGLVTNRKKNILFKNGLNAQAEIIISNRPFLLKLIQTVDLL